MPECPICSSTGSRSTVEDLYWCVACDHVFEWPLKPRKTYDASYVRDRYDSYPTTPLMSHLRLGLVKGVKDKGRLLDVGYGNGDFIKTAIKGGFDAFGYDVHRCGDLYGIREASLDSGLKWDVVTFFDSLEHMPGFFEVRSLISRSRCVIVSTPNRPSLFPEGEGTLKWKHYRPGEHLHYFSHNSLQRLFSPLVLYLISDVEDTIRGKAENGENNVNTFIFENAEKNL